MKNKYLLAILLTGIVPNLILAQWNSSSTLNTPVAVLTAGQKNIHSVSDANRGIIITWEDSRNNGTTSTDIYAQRLDHLGNARWTTNGTPVCNFSATQKNASIIDAGDGSAIITWQDERSGNTDIYAQKIDSSGTMLWSTNGVIISNKLTTQRNPKIVSDNAGGAIIVWEDSSNFYFDIYAQRINNLGVIQWTTNGVAICTSVNLQINPKIEIDGLGGAIVTWQDKRNSTDYNIYAQRIDASGQVLWLTNGVVLCNAVNTQNNPRIEPDGANGAYVSWVDKRNAIDYNIYAQRIDSNGTTLWVNNGIVLCNASGNQSGIDMKYLGTNGILVSWKDLRTNSNTQIYYQLINTQGVSQLTSNGVQLSSGIKAANANVIATGTGEGIIVWQDSITITGWDIKAQKISSTGTMLWLSGGRIVSDTQNDQINASNVSDGNGGAIFVWEDYRNTSDYDIFAHHIADTNISTSVSVLNKNNLVKCYPNPITELNSNFHIVSANKIEKKVKIYNPFGQLIVFSSTDKNGVFTMQTNGLSAGVYFFKLESIADNIFTLEQGSFIVIK